MCAKSGLQVSLNQPQDPLDVTETRFRFLLLHFLVHAIVSPFIDFVLLELSSLTSSSSIVSATGSDFRSLCPRSYG